MAIARGAGTEIIRTVHMESVNATGRKLIMGVQHHIYTVLSISVYVDAINAAANFVTCAVVGYDSLGGDTAQFNRIFQQDMQLNQTFVWNDKFSFNGFEPVDFTGPLDDATKQDAIADQGSAVPQYLSINAEHASDGFDITCTYIDQNNA